MVAIVDDEDFYRISAFKWYAHQSSASQFYARRDYRINGVKYKVYMHRFIMKVDEETIQVDHINGNRLDNRKENLRICSNQQNSRNKRVMRSDNTSGYRGVDYRKDPRYKNKWSARITLPSGKKKHLGQFPTAEAAARAFDRAAKEIYGEFCGNLNFE